MLITPESFDAWPAESLKAIAAHYVGLTEVGEEAEKCAAACHLFQQSSPHEPQATFLRLMRCFVRLHGASSKAISTKRGRYISGLQKLDQAAEQVNKQHTISKLQFQIDFGNCR